ncbi:J domain-containing protein [Aneurinibacillus aneurinilyticus]|jgi:hypothetical protein|uniref:J domain-containing protein n=1 Tax=Aneurinibacillus aneurinilyticus TaxID=1391 RepID=UPI0023F86EF0|nr:J domain-containing protein [Aneurinibacillus aneurinilyticus]MCI1695803.1 J domain-containing protein [Aneurinibacillus aneurinilyticus]
MSREEQEASPQTGRSSMLVTDVYLLDLIQAISSLIPIWRRRLEEGLVRLDFAVEVGKKLTPKFQERLFDFLHDQPIPKKQESKVLLAFSFGMPEWAILEILRLYKQADKTREAIVMYNDLMDRFEKIFHEEFEYQFLAGEMPKDEQELSDILSYYQKSLQTLYEQSPRSHTSRAYSRMYSDSSSSFHPPAEPAGGQDLYQLLGISQHASREDMKKQYRHLMKVLHPDSGGSAYLFNLVKKAYEAEK